MGSTNYPLNVVFYLSFERTIEHLKGNLYISFIFNTE